MTADAAPSPVDARQRQVVEALYQRTGRALASRVERVVGRSGVPEEIVQEAFARLWREALLFPSERAAFSWLYRTSHRLALDFLRGSANKLSAVDRFDDDAALPWAGDVEEAGKRHENRQLVRRLLARLPEDEADVFVLKVVDGMTLDEIAALNGVSSKTIQRTLARVEETFAKMKGEA